MSEVPLIKENFYSDETGPQEYICSRCKSPLSENNFFKLDNTLFCLKCIFETMAQRSQSVPSSPNHVNKCARCGKVKPSSCFFTYRRLGQTTADNVCSSCRTIYNRKHPGRLSPDDIITTNRLFDTIATSPHSAFYSYTKEEGNPTSSVISVSPETISSSNSINSNISSPQVFQLFQEPPPPQPPVPLQSRSLPLQTQLPPQIETTNVSDVNYFSNILSLSSPILSMSNLFSSLSTTPLASGSSTPSSSTTSSATNSNNSATLEQLHQLQQLQQQLLLEQQQQQLQQQHQQHQQQQQQRQQQQHFNSNNNCYSPIHTSFFCNNNSNSNLINTNNSPSRMMLNTMIQQQQQSPPPVPLPIHQIRSNNNNGSNTLQLRNYAIDSPITVSTPTSTTSSSTSINTTRRRTKSKKNQEIDFRISYENLRKLVTTDVYNGLRKDKFNELVIYSNNATDIVTQIPDEKTRTNIMLNEITIFYHISSEEVCCKSCGKKIAQIECFIHENYVICKDCSLKVDIRDLSDWEYTGKRPIQLQCVRCKHIIPYHKFLKYNRKDEIKRQNTCSYCRLKQWIDYYRS